MQTVEAQIDDILAKMTLEEKITVCHAGSKFAVAGIERLGIPEFTMSDGPHGVRREISRDSWEPLETEDDYSTYLPTGTALASTWNDELGRLFGETLGSEARARGKDIILGPGVNIVRSPLCGRNFEYFGEDPHHIARMVVPVIQGIQSQGVAACVKHYAANSQELNRHTVDAIMDERTLREIYTPGFQAAVVEGDCLTVMGAYNKFRGQWCCHNAHLLNGILKGEWKFTGSVISDWAGTHDMLEAANNGLDIEMGTDLPYDEYYLARPFREAIQRGELSEDLLDEKVRRNLRVIFRIGLFDAGRPVGERNTPKHQQAALAVAREAIILLKNEGGILPLDAGSIRKLVVVGENATVKHALGGNSSGVKALYEVSPLEGLQRLVGESITIQHFRGYPSQDQPFEPIRAEYLGTADEGAGTHGWKARYFSDRNWAKEFLARADGDIAFDWGAAAPLPGLEPGQFSVLWETTLQVPQSGTYEFILSGAEHAGLAIDDQQLIQRWEGGGPDVVQKAIALEAGKTYRLSVALKPYTTGVHAGLTWTPPWLTGKAESPQELLDAAAAADAVLFFGGLNHQYDVEGGDRNDMALHDGQNELLSQLAALNPRTVAIMVSGSPVEMPWVDEVPAIVQMWYAGMEGGTAIAEILFGQVNPSGKLPMTFPRHLADSPAHALGDYAPDVCYYKEGIFVGYRWFDAKKIEPLFPFGHGLSYTTFTLANFQVTRGESGLSASVDLTNTGSRAGAEVVQLYVSQPQASVERPPRELKAFAKVQLAPGETRQVTLPLPPEAFAYWHPEKGAWTTDEAKFVIEAGPSSRNLLCSQTISLP